MDHHFLGTINNFREGSNWILAKISSSWKLQSILEDKSAKSELPEKVLRREFRLFMYREPVLDRFHSMQAFTKGLHLKSLSLHLLK